MEEVNKEISKEFYLLAVLMPLFFISMARLPMVKPLDGKCFPDYRPGFGCMVFEKQPY